VEWANVKYQVTPGFSVRAGRTLLPTFLRSDTRKVAYTYPWVRPPVEVYHLVPVSNINGVDVRYHLRTGGITNTWQANYGSAEITLPSGGTIKGKQAWSLSYTAEYHAATVHVAYQSARVTLDSVNPSLMGSGSLVRKARRSQTSTTSTTSLSLYLPSGPHTILASGS
jgi:hypothetical protein